MPLLSNLIRNGGLAKVATATVATQEATNAGTVAAANAPQPPAAVMAGVEETAIRAWLAHIEETEPDIIAEVLDQCHADLEARVYFLRRVKVVLRQSNDQSALSRPAP
jgi:hypothetical protein